MAPPPSCARSAPSPGTWPTCSRRAGPPTAASARTPTGCSSTTSSRSSSSPRPRTSRSSTSTRSRAIGIDPLEHDIRFVEDDWESPTLGAWGLGWEVWCDGHGDHPVHLLPAVRRLRVPAGLRRADLRPRAHLHVPAGRRQRLRPRVGARACSYREVFHANEVRDGRRTRFDEADPEQLFALFDGYEKECKRLLRRRSCRCRPTTSALKCSHTFNLLDARGAISRHRARRLHQAGARQRPAAAPRATSQMRERLGYPLLQDRVDGRRAAAAARGHPRQQDWSRSKKAERRAVAEDLLLRDRHRGAARVASSCRRSSDLERIVAEARRSARSPHGAVRTVRHAAAAGGARGGGASDQSPDAEQAR